MNKFLKRKLISNGYGKLIKKLEEISPEDSDKVAKGVELIFANFNCSPKPDLIFDIIDYLNFKSNKMKSEFQSYRHEYEE